MIRTISVILLVVTSAFALAEEMRIPGQQIEDLLSDAYVIGAGYSQRFFAPKNGQWPAGTTYDEGGNLTFGKWEVRANHYCSVWPPSETWACYQMYIEKRTDETRLIWIDDTGRRFVGVLSQ